MDSVRDMLNSNQVDESHQLIINTRMGRINLVMKVWSISVHKIGLSKMAAQKYIQYFANLTVCFSVLARYTLPSPWPLQLCGGIQIGCINMFLTSFWKTEVKNSIWYSQATSSRGWVRQLRQFDLPMTKFVELQVIVCQKPKHENWIIWNKNIR